MPVSQWYLHCWQLRHHLYSRERIAAGTCEPTAKHEKYPSYNTDVEPRRQLRPGNYISANSLQQLLQDPLWAEKCERREDLMASEDSKRYRILEIISATRASTTVASKTGHGCL